jgi:hypothetical protein
MRSSVLGVGCWVLGFSNRVDECELRVSHGLDCVHV